MGEADGITAKVPVSSETGEFNILNPDHSRMNGDCPHSTLSSQEAVLALQETQAPSIRVTESSMAASGPG